MFDGLYVTVYSKKKKPIQAEHDKIPWISSWSAQRDHQRWLHTADASDTQQSERNGWSTQATCSVGAWLGGLIVDVGAHWTESIDW